MLYSIKMWDGATAQSVSDYVILCSSEHPSGVIDIALSKEVGKAESLTFSVLPNNDNINNIKPMLTYLEVEYLDKIVFRGRVSSVETDFYGQKNVQCEGALAFLIDSIQTEKETLFMSLFQDITFAIEYHNNQMYYRNNEVYRPKQFMIGDVTTVWNPINKTTEYSNESLRSAIIWTDGSEIDTSGSEYATTQPKMSDDLIALTLDGDGTPPDMLTVYALAHQEIPEGTTSENHYLGLAFYSDNNDPPTFISRYIATPAGTSDFVTLLAEKGHIPSNAKYVRILGTTYGRGLGLIENATRIDFKTDSAMTTSEYMEEVYCRRYGGFLRVRYGTDAMGLNYIDYMSEKPKDIHDSSIEYAVNLIDISTSQEYSDPYSRLIPTSNGKVWNVDGGHEGYSYTTDPATGTKRYMHKNLIYVENELAVAKFGRINRLQDVGDLSNITEVRKAAEKFMQIYDPMLPDKLEVTAVDIAAIRRDGSVNQIDVGDTVLVKCPHLGIETTAMCIAININFINPENNTYTIGKYVPDTDDYKRETLSAIISKKR